jgi:hypothetical protein
VNYAFQFPQHLLVREAQNDVALRFKPSVAFHISVSPRFKIMAFAIELYDHAGRMTDEIGDEISQRDLPPESQTFDPVRLDVAPQ